MAGFDRPISSLKNMSLMFHTGKVLQPKHKLRILRVRLTPLEPVEKYAARGDLSPFQSIPALDN